MQVQTILNQCYKFKSFVYHQVAFYLPQFLRQDDALPSKFT